MVLDKFLRGRRRDQLTADDLATLEEAAGGIQTLAARKMLVHKGDQVGLSTYLIDGFMCRYLDDRRGERQLIAIHIPGDFVDLHGYPLGRLDHDVAAITTCQIAQVSHSRLDEIVAQRPRLTKLLWFSTLLDAAMHREWIFRLGRLDAVKRLGHFFCETEARLRRIGLSDGNRFILPLTQMDLGEACGLTPVHVNRMLRELRERGLLHMQSSTVTILDRPSLYRMCEFDPGYLYFDEDRPEHG